ncbi:MULTISPECIES: hypothetical protein [unclassified Leptolyngbya]|uniref:M10 family metallopeptidase C-terminal domain-containing protein n=1 Tax=unclassified Leptolyngbya TaxID=2650499 RepID=UPI0016886390|nr:MULTISPECIES: hypothetical protein [unclassified Leptolyngbya]MBD1913786.1 hypothetical protein [Leptolyngbya sp. FACHB-8]MBD2156130.1 hypothetical protein [Leptolyngbya sp. FACHB-16]
MVIELQKIDVVGNGSSFPSYLASANGTLFFGAVDTVNGVEDYELYYLDSTNTPVKIDVNPIGSSYARSFVSINDAVFFSGVGVTRDWELYYLDENKSPIKIDANLTGSSYPNQLFNYNGTLFFQATDVNENEDYELWYLNANGTPVEIDINPAGSSFPTSFVNVNNTLYFSANVNNDYELYYLDSSNNPVAIGINQSGSSFPQFLTNVNGTLFFQAVDTTGDYELYYLDANKVPTKIDINPTGSSFPQYLANVEGRLFFQGTDDNGDIELYYLRPDNTPVKLDISATGSSTPKFLTSFNGKLFFQATVDGDTELYYLDTNNNPVKIDINQSASSSPKGFTVVNDNLFFQATDTNGDVELYQLLDRLGIDSVSLPGDRTYTIGENLDFTVTFSKAVTINLGGGSVRIPITLDSGEVVYATLVGDGTSATRHTFRYTVSNGQLDTNGITVGTSLELTGNATVRDSANTNSPLTFPPLGTTAGIQIDGIAPSVTGVALPANNIYQVGQNLNFTITFSEAVTLNTSNGTPKLSLILANRAVNATYISGNGSNTLLFRYTVAEGDLDSDGIVLGTALVLDGSTIRDANGNNASLALNGIPSTSGILIGSDEPSILLVEAPNAGRYRADQALDFTLNFSEVVNVNTDNGIPSLGLNLNSGLANAVYVSGTGTKQLVFRYTVASTDSDTDGITLDTLNLNGATLQDASNHNAVLTLPGSPNTSGILIDTTAPTVSVVAVSPVVQDGRDNVATSSLSFTFNESVTGVDIADVSLTRNGVALNLAGATLTANSSQTSYTLSNLTGLTTLDGSYTLSILATSSGIADLAGNLLATGAAVSWKRGTMALAPANINFSGGSVGRRFTGKSGNETILGTRANDTLSGAGGNDTIRGLEGNDLLNGEIGSDVIFGGAGNDRLLARVGNDQLSGDAGNDLLQGDAGNDLLNGGDGNDILVGGLGTDTLTGGLGTDAFRYNSLTEKGDIIRGFQVGQDVIDLSPLFRTTPFRTGTPFARFDRYVRLSASGTSTRIQIDQDGVGAGTTFVTLATLENVRVGQLTSRNFAIA